MSCLKHRRYGGPRGFTLIELLVVMVIIGLLVGMLLPAVQNIRESARVTSCSSNLRQVTLAVANYEARTGHYPPSFKATAPDASGNVNGWSAQALLLPHLEQVKLFSTIDFDRSYKEAVDIETADGVATRLSAMRIPTYLCPSERRDEVRLSGGAPEHYPLNYAVNLGEWFVYDPETGEGGSGSFFPESRLKTAEFGDGLSFTMCAAEVKAWQPYYRNAASAVNPGLPLADAVGGLGGDFKANTGHTEWVDGRAHQAGFTTALRPNTEVPSEEGGVVYDVDWTNQQEGKSDTVPTYAVVTSRSYHGGGVNVSMMDGSVRWFSDEVNLGVWRAYSTRDRGEFLPSDQPRK